jgi:O-antigen ligase
VIAYEGQRILRGYGGFPHPNIAGIWFAFGLAASFWLIRNAETKWAGLLGWFMCVILPFALVLTFSRSAFLAAFILLGATCFMIFARRPIDIFLLRPFIWSLICFLTIAILVWPLLLSRGSVENHLEIKSVSERASSWTGIWPSIGEHPFIGHGIGSSRLQVQPPHAVPLIILFETGILGLLSVGILFMVLWKYTDLLGRVLLTSLVPPFFLDHYFYSLWAGISLLILAIYFIAILDKIPESR